MSSALEGKKGKTRKIGGNPFDISFSWVSSTIFRARKRELIEEDLCLPDRLTANVCTDGFVDAWQLELDQAASRPPSLVRALRRCYLREFIIAGIFKLLWGVLILLAAFFFVNQLLITAQNYVDKKSDNVTNGWILSAFMFVDCILLSVALQQMTTRSSQLGIKVRATMTTAIFRKALVLADVNVNSGDVVNLASADCNKLLEACTTLHYLWSGTVEAVAICVLLAVLTKAAVAPGVAICLIIIPAQFLIGTAVTRFRRKYLEGSAERMKMVSELLMGAKLVKFYCWERFFAERINEHRQKELHYLWKAAVVKSISLVIVFIIPPLMALVMFSMYVGIYAPLTSAVSFTTLSLFNTLRFPLIQLPKAIKNFAESRASLARIQEFLLLPEVKPLPRQDTIGASMVNADITFDGQPVLRNVTFDLSEGKLMTIAGTVGAGKTTLFKALLGQANITEGSAAVGGRVAYVPQQSWIQRGTVRDNILFGQPFDVRRYNKVVHACALEPDFRTFPRGDLEEIGERGANLSGGQRQRISLARAVYSQADVYILDAPLSAVDQHTSNHIFTHCIKGLLKGKTVLMSTHKVYLLAQSDLVGIVKHGQLAYFGPFEQDKLMDHMSDLMVTAADLEEIQRLQANPQHVTAPETALDADDEHEVHDAETELQPATDLAQAESQTQQQTKPKKWRRMLPCQGSDLEDGDDSESRSPRSATSSKRMDPSKVGIGIDNEDFSKQTGFRVYRRWAQAAGYLIAFIALISHPIAQLFRIGNDYWISVWTGNLLKEGQYFYVGIQAIFVFAFFCGLIFRGFSFYLASWRAARSLHRRMLQRILHAPFSFFVLTPVGRLLNTFSSVQDQVDETLPDTFHLTLVYCMILLTTTTLVCVVLPPFIGIALALYLSFAIVVPLYIPAGRAVKSLVGTTTSRVFSHVGEVVTGLPVIRAFAAQSRFVAENISFVDRNDACLYTLDQMQGWLAFRLDIVACLLVLGNALLCIGLVDQYPPRVLGLSISNSFQALIFFNWVVRGFADVDSLISNVGTVGYYGSDQIDQEFEGGDKSAVGDKWPEHGHVQFEGVTLSYFPAAPPALRGVSVDIKAGDKVGVVGRTGSGKSTLLIALFRLVEPSSGAIFIDGVDASHLGLQTLRSRLAIIPQEPVMFAGTVRANLDPLGEYDDAQLWRALEVTHLKPFIETLPGKLDDPVTDSGSNWSMGYKQLLCLCRAVLKKSSILVLDEATAAVDPKTESLVVHTIKDVFAACTVITIAHRLDTIIESDKILVMERGEVMEFDTPYKLLADTNSHFAHLVNETGLAADALRNLAYAHHLRSGAPSTSPSPPQPPVLSDLVLHVGSL